jgi:hypothetical protein
LIDLFVQIRKGGGARLDGPARCRKAFPGVRFANGIEVVIHNMRTSKNTRVTAALLTVARQKIASPAELNQCERSMLDHLRRAALSSANFKLLSPSGFSLV